MCSCTSMYEFLKQNHSSYFTSSPVHISQFFLRTNQSSTSHYAFNSAPHLCV
ncbi:hypothetical protein CROQUDRAFT_660960, partial [Cronartium quercuum f. sp. fusiforme G11]